MANFTLFAFPGSSSHCTSYSDYAFFDSHGANPNLTGEHALLHDDVYGLACSYNYLCPYSILGVYNGSSILNDKGPIHHQIFGNDDIIVSGRDLYMDKNYFDGQVEFFPEFQSSGTVLTEISESMFSNTSLVSVRMPYNKKDGVVVKSGAFSGCSQLSYIYCYNAIKEVEEGAFSGCTSLIGDEVSCKNYMACYPNYVGCLVKTNFFDTLKICFDCGSSSFRGCTSLSSITFYTGSSTYDEPPYPYASGKYNIGSYAFEGCTGLEWINGYSYNIDNYRYVWENSGYDVYIPDSINLSGANYCFANCTSLNGTLWFESITDNVRIPEGAFSGCTGITYINNYYYNTKLPCTKDDYTTYIEDNAFADTGIPVELREEVLKNIVNDESSVTSEEITRIFGS